MPFVFLLCFSGSLSELIVVGFLVAASLFFNKNHKITAESHRAISSSSSEVLMQEKEGEMVIEGESEEIEGRKSKKENRKDKQSMYNIVQQSVRE